MKKLFLFLSAAILLTFQACEPAITGISLSKTTLEMEVGDQATLTASVQPAGVKDVSEFIYFTEFYL